MKFLLTCLAWVNVVLSLAHGFPVLGSMYADTGAAAGGLKLGAYPVRLQIGCRRMTLYPVAVYTDKVQQWKYSILKIRYKKRSIYAHVVDECSSSTSSCRENKAKARGSGRMLIDIHQRAWKQLGIDATYGLHILEAKKIGKAGRKQLQKYLTDDGKQDYVPKQWI